MAPSRSTPQMMQVTRAAFQAVASLNEQATDPKSHTLVKNSLQDSFTSCYLLNSDGRPTKRRTLLVRKQKIQLKAQLPLRAILWPRHDAVGPYCSILLD